MVYKLDHGKRHEPLSLMSMADNIKFSKHKDIRGHEYHYYNNYDGLKLSVLMKLRKLDFQMDYLNLEVSINKHM